MERATLNGGGIASAALAMLFTSYLRFPPVAAPG
jgi:hypothetical protein